MQLVQHVYQQLLEIERLERESHQKWDNAMMNMRPGMSQEHLQKYRQQTYEATELHSQAMDLLRGIMKKVNDAEYN